MHPPQKKPPGKFLSPSEKTQITINYPIYINISFSADDFFDHKQHHIEIIGNLLDYIHFRIQCKIVCGKPAAPQSKLDDLVKSRIPEGS